MEASTSPTWKAVIGAVLVAGCAGASLEDAAEREQRLRAIEERIKASMPKTMEVALDQPSSPETVKMIQERLRTLDHFHGEADGKLDFVTVNAIMAFQRSLGRCGPLGLELYPCVVDNGILDQESLARLDEHALATIRARLGS